MRSKDRKQTKAAAKDEKAARTAGGKTANARQDRRRRRRRENVRTRSALRRRAHTPPRPAGADEMAAAGNADDAIRAILTSLHVPLACEEKACRRSHRCVGKHRPDEEVLTVPCYDRHRATLQPFFCAHVLPVLKAVTSEAELEDKF